MAEWRDMDNIPKGMQDFKRWFRPQGLQKSIMPSDGDAIIHTLGGNRFILFEFKPSIGSLSIGQAYTLNGFSRLPGCTAILIADPYNDDQSRTNYSDDQQLDVRVYKDNSFQEFTITVGELNTAIELWFEFKGPLFKAVK